jgi:hypothetical protein
MEISPPPVPFESPLMTTSKTRLLDGFGSVIVLIPVDCQISETVSSALAAPAKPSAAPAIAPLHSSAEAHARAPTPGRRAVRARMGCRDCITPEYLMNCTPNASTKGPASGLRTPEVRLRC